MNEAYRSLLAEFLARSRWFGGKGRSFTVGRIEPLGWLSESPRSRLELVEVNYSDRTSEVYQLFVTYLAHHDPSLDHALIGPLEEPELGSVVAYQAVHLHAANALLLDGFRAAAAGSAPQVDGVTFHVVPDRGLPDSDLIGSVLAAEQSNTSVVYGDAAILKLFRRVSPGRNPDIEIHEALTTAGFPNVAGLLGWISGRWPSSDGTPAVADLGMLQVFLRTATGGWDLALASVRDLLDEEDLHPSEVGGDFAGESARLGETVAAVHVELARLFPVRWVEPPEAARTAEVMRSRLAAAIDAVPQLEEHADALAARFDRLNRLTQPVPIQRIHGDLHLGQTLRTVKGWKILDFEGEPAKALSERSGLSTPLRDVAGMLRSFDYAAGVTLQGFGHSTQLSYRADEWSERNCAAFLEGYGAVAGPESADQADVLAAFEADKAVYEAVYEARNRPGWVEIPLRGIARMSGNGAADGG